MKFESECDLPINVLYAWIKYQEKSNIWKVSDRKTSSLN